MPRTLIMAMISSAPLLAGCEVSEPTVVPVSGTLTFNGKPLEGANLTFMPDPSNAELTPGGATTETGGTYAAVYRDRKGLAPGKYKVLVTRTFVPAGTNVPDAFKDDPSLVAPPEPGPSKNSLPTEYLDPERTPLSIEVPIQGDTFDFDVKGRLVKR